MSAADGIDHAATARGYENDANSNLNDIIGTHPALVVQSAGTAAAAQALLAISHQLARITELLEERR